MNLYIFYIIWKNSVSGLETFFELDKYIAFLIFDNVIFIYIFSLKLGLWLGLGLGYFSGIFNNFEYIVLINVSYLSLKSVFNSSRDLINNNFSNLRDFVYLYIYYILFLAAYDNYFD